MIYGSCLTFIFSKIKDRKEEIKKKKGCRSVPLAILMSRAVRIKAIKVELKCTVLSSATGRSMRSSLCEEPIRGDEGGAV